MIKKIFLYLTQSVQFILWHFPISILAVVGIYFAFKILINPLVDTVSITNYAFAIVIALSSVSFSYEKTYKGETVGKEKLRYCGERFLHSSILFLIASVIKYFLMQDDVLAFSNSSSLLRFIFLIIRLFPGFLFLGSLVNVIAALRELNLILFSQKKPFEELKKIF
jgi:hypothetical protein